MSGDPMKLVKLMCAAKAHATARSESALTIQPVAAAPKDGKGTTR